MQPVRAPLARAGVLARQCGGANNVIWTRTACRRFASSSGSKPPTRPNTPKPLPYKQPRPKPQPGHPPAKASSEPAGSSSKAQPVSELVRSRWFPLFGIGAATVCISYFVAAQAVHWNKEPVECYAPGLEPQAPTGRPSIQSPVEFDLHLDKSEWRLGITKLRRKLAAGARGHVLEVALGTGRNLEFYDWAGITATPEEAKKRALEKLKKVGGDRSKLADLGADEVRSFTGIDISPPMLDVALRRARQVVPHIAGALPKRPLFSQLASRGQHGLDCIALRDDKLRVFTTDAQSTLPPPPTGDKYDTVIQTFGLCSVRDPTLLLAKMASVLKPETGRIILLEHGRSWWDMVNGLLDRSARGHFERFGCWWNRDIELIVRDAERRVPGLEVVKLERPGLLTMGTHIWIELRLRRAVAIPKVDDGPGKVKERRSPDGEDEKPWGSRFGNVFGSGSVLSVGRKFSGPKEP
ncbi:hypothetical protein DL768_004097 [Monosporascus sp. mg162]|nr:hypothetical protein DL768_004097 [Monosporascus sp. mg162]